MPKKKPLSVDMVERTAKIEQLIEKVGGRFTLTVLIQKRIKEINQGSRPLINDNYQYLVDLVLKEIEEDKIALVDADEKEIISAE